MSAGVQRTHPFRFHCVNASISLDSWQRKWNVKSTRNKQQIELQSNEIVIGRGKNGLSCIHIKFNGGGVDAAGEIPEIEEKGKVMHRCTCSRYNNIQFVL